MNSCHEGMFSLSVHMFFSFLDILVSQYIISMDLRKDEILEKLFSTGILMYSYIQKSIIRKKAAAQWSDSFWLKVQRRKLHLTYGSGGEVHEKTLIPEFPQNSEVGWDVCNTLRNSITEAHKDLTESRENERDFELE